MNHPTPWRVDRFEPTDGGRTLLVAANGQTVCSWDRLGEPSEADLNRIVQAVNVYNVVAEQVEFESE